MFPGRATVAVAVVLCAAPAASAREIPDTVPPASWTAIATPIPRSTLLAALGLDPGLPRALTLVEAVRRLHEDDTRRGPLRARLSAMLLAHGTSAAAPARTRAAPDASPPRDAPAAASGGTDDDLVPLPLTERFWESCITKPRNVAGSVASAIVTDPAAGLMYVALASTDPSTRVFLADQCEQVSAIARTRAAAFSIVARSFRVRGRRVDLPGGDAALPLWRRLGLPVTAPADFLTRLVSADAGRLAYFFDLIAQLDPARQRYALGLSEPSGPNLEIGAAVYRVCTESDPSWSILERPFARMPIDVAFVLQQVRLAPGGRPSAPGTEAFLSAAFADGDIDRARDDASQSVGGPTVDAATLARLVMVPDWNRRRARLMTLLYAQRVFADLQPADAPAALTALRGIARVETLPFALERIGVRSPAVIAAAVRRALLFGAPMAGVAVVGADRQRAEISSFQGALALVERLVYARAVSRQAAGDLIQRLLDERTPDPLGYTAHVAHWIEEDLLRASLDDRRTAASAAQPLADASGPVAAAEGGREGRLLDAVAGLSPEPPLLVTWEDTRYRVDLASAERARLRAIRRRQGGPSLDDALDLIGSARALRGADAADDLPAVRGTLERLAAHLGAADSGEVPSAGTVDALAVVTSAARAIESRQPTPSTRVQQARRLADLGAIVLGDVLRSLVYACALGDAEGQAFLAGDVSRLHEFGLDEPDASRRRIRAWELPADVSAGGRPWHLTGSLLAVDLAVSRFALRRTLGNMPSRQPTLSGPDRRTLLATLALMNAADLADDTRTALVAAMRRGREVLEEALESDEHADAELRRAGVTGWRTALLRWAWSFDRAAVFSLVARSELVWLGTASPFPGDIDAWGAPTQTIDGAWALRFPGPEPIDAVGGRQASAYLPGRFADLTLRLAEIMAELGVPAPLTREVLRTALQGFVDEARPAYPDDWLALVRHAGALTRAQVEDYVYALTVADGPLVPVDRSEPEP